MIINTLIIGLGNVGMIYDNPKNPKLIQSHAKSLSLHPNFNLMAGIDPVLEKRNLFEKTYKKIAFKSINDFKNESQINSKIDLIIISTPTETHLKVIEESLDIFNPKAILCEKPLSYNYEDAEKIIRICDDFNVDIFVNYMRRCDPGVIEIKNKLDRNIIKNPLKGNCWYSKGLYNNGSHFINLLEFWLGNYKKLKIIDKGRSFNSKDIEPEFFIEFEKGSIIFRSAWEEHFSFYNIELISESGLLKYRKGGEQINLYKVENDKRYFGYKNIGNKEYNIKSEMEIYQYNVLEEISKNFLGKYTTICKGKEALRTQKIIYLISKNL
tara:strand:+ start:3038 stop:4012 length:975 start_codon:yes stop_codon:yes gene_type:complete